MATSPSSAKWGNHPKDRHVLAAALACKADYLVPLNLRGFPRRLAISQRLSRLREQADAIIFGVEELLDRVEQSVPAFVEILRSRD
jgi:hypothetical protein